MWSEGNYLTASSTGWYNWLVRDGYESRRSDELDTQTKESRGQLPSVRKLRVGSKKNPILFVVQEKNFDELSRIDVEKGTQGILKVFERESLHLKPAIFLVVFDLDVNVRFGCIVERLHI
jgi:hypothetical protein